MLKQSQAMSSAQHIIFSGGHANVIERATKPTSNDHLCPSAEEQKRSLAFQLLKGVTPAAEIRQIAPW